MEFTESLKEQLLGALQNANGSVEIKLYKGNEANEEVTSVLDLLKGIEALVPNIKLSEEETGGGIVRYPAIQIASPGEKSSYTYYGLPSGYEFASLIEAIRTVASGSVDLDEKLAEKIRSIAAPVSLEIFVTPSCSYCPAVVISAFRVSRVNPLIHVEIVEATSFRPYARGKGVMGVPKTLINDGAKIIDGSVGIEDFVEKIISI